MRIQFNDLEPGLDAIRITVIRPKRECALLRRRALLPESFHGLDGNPVPTRLPDDADQFAVVKPRVQGFEPHQLLHNGWRDVPARDAGAPPGKSPARAQAAPGAGSGV